MVRTYIQKQIENIVTNDRGYDRTLWLREDKKLPNYKDTIEILRNYLEEMEACDDRIVRDPLWAKIRELKLKELRGEKENPLDQFTQRLMARYSTAKGY